MILKRILYITLQDIRTCLTFRTTAILLILPIFFWITSIFLTDHPFMTWNLPYTRMFCAIFNTTSLSTCVLPILICKEKEEKTLRSLYLCGIKDFEFISAKLLSILGVLLCTTSLLLLESPSYSYYFTFLFLNILISLALFPIGLLIAIFADDVNHANDLATPILILFILLPILRTRASLSSFLTDILPTSSLAIATDLFFTETQLSLSALLPSIILNCIWMLLGWSVFLYKHKTMGLRLKNYEAIDMLLQNNRKKH